MSLEMVDLPPRFEELEVSISWRISLLFWRTGGRRFSWVHQKDDRPRSSSVAMKACSLLWRG